MALFHTAHYILEKGLNHGDRVALLFETSLEYVISYYGALKAEGVTMPLNSDLKSEGLSAILREVEPKIIFSSSKFEKLLQMANLDETSIQEMVLKTPKLRWSSRPFTVAKLEDLMQAGFSPNPSTEIQETDLASIIYTGGIVSILWRLKRFSSGQGC